ncbi:MAG: hypothetical protein EHM74_06405 [Hyphomicrobiales bacterium]|nr:MAG: hypothetical protein EHM74_06405 [Hyphomicrobiales bacterium]
MEELIRSGRIAHVIIAILLIELVVVSVYLLRRGRTREVLSAGASIIAGGALVMALGLALAGGGWKGIGVCLLISLVAHLAELVIRLSRQDAGSNRSGIGPTLQDRNRETST